MLKEVGQVYRSVKRHRFDHDQQVQAGWGSQVLPGGGTVPSSPAHNGRNTIRAVVEHDRPLADDRRRGDVTHSGSSLECGKQVWSTGWYLLLDVEKGTVREKWHYDSDGRRVHTMLRKRTPIMDSIRRCGLHPLPEEVLPVGQSMVDMTSFRDTVVAFSNCARLTILGPTLGITTTAPQYLVGVSHQFLGLDWDSGDDGDNDTEESTEEKESGEFDMWNVGYVLEALSA